MISFLKGVAPQALSPKRWAVGVVVSGAILAFLLWWSAPQGVVQALGEASAGWIASGLLAMVFVGLCRYVRLWFWVPPSQRSWFLFGVVNAHSLLNHVLPFRTGELVFPFLLQRATGRAYVVGLSDLFMLRVVELCVLSSCVLVAALSWQLTEQAAVVMSARSGWIPLALIFPFVVLLVALFSGRRVLRVLGTFFDSRPRLQRLGLLCRQLGDAFAARTWGNLATVFVTTLVMWCGLFVVYYSALSACGIDASWEETVLGSLGSVVANLLPVNGIGSVGTMEAGWVAGFVLLGKSATSAMAAGVLLHVMLVAALTAMALFALPRPNPSSHPQREVSR